MSRSLYRAVQPATIIVLLLALCSPLLAQTPTTHEFSNKAASSLPWLLLLHNVVFLTWLIGSLVIAWLFSVIMSMVMIQAFYPPNAARFACWLSATLWSIFFTFVLFGHIVPYFLPMWLISSLLLALFVAGIIALVTRRHPA